MKGILISTQPKWVEKILNRIKKDEVRKGTALYKAINKLIAEQGVAPMLIYCTKKYDECLWYKKDSQRYVLNYGKPTNDYLNGKVVARFNATAEEIVTVNRLDTGEVILYRGHKDGLTNRELMEGSCLTFKEMNDYLQGEKGTVIHINDLEIFDKPMEIKDLVRPCKEPIDYCGESCLECPYAVLSQYSDYDDALPLGDMKKVERCLLITKLKAPQSYCFIKI